MFTHEVSIKNQLLPNNSCQLVPFLMIFGHEQYLLAFYASTPFRTTLHICRRSTGLECVGPYPRQTVNQKDEQSYVQAY